MIRTLSRQGRRVIASSTAWRCDCNAASSMRVISGSYEIGDSREHQALVTTGWTASRCYSSGDDNTTSGRAAGALPHDSSSPSASTSSAGAAPSGRKPGEGRDMMMVFTCSVCETRAVKTMSRTSYESGVVIVTCPGCQNRHLIADRLGWFGEPGSIEDYLAQKGEAVFRGQDDGTLELPPEVLAGWSPKRPSQQQDQEQQEKQPTTEGPGASPASSGAGEAGKP